MTSRPLITGIHAASITVRDFGPHLLLYADALGWAVVSDVAISERSAERLWGIAVSAHAMVLSCGGATTGKLCLIRFGGGVTPVSYGYPPVRVNGFFAIDMYVKSQEEAQRRVENAGARFAARARWEVAGEGRNIVVRQGRVEAPDDVNLVFVQPDVPRQTQAWTHDPQSFCTELTSVVVGSPDVSRSKEFWGESGLGLPIIYDTVFAQPEMCAMCGVEQDAAFRMAFGVGESTARIEILGRAPAGRDPYDQTPSVDLATHQRAGLALGQTSWTVVVRDLDEAMRVCRSQGLEVRGPFENEETKALWGGSRLATTITPEGVWLELIET